MARVKIPGKVACEVLGRIREEIKKELIREYGSEWKKIAGDKWRKKAPNIDAYSEISMMEEMIKESITQKGYEKCELEIWLIRTFKEKC